MKNGKIIKITRDYVPGTDRGEIKDVITGVKYKFESPRNVYKFDEEVHYAPIDPSQDLKPNGQVKVRKKRGMY